MATKRAIHGTGAGFILLEVLIAMSLILSSWFALTHTYQAMVMQFAQSQEKRVTTRKAADQFETHTHQVATSQRDGVVESTRLSSRPRAEPDLNQPAHKNQRSIRGKAN